MIIDCNANLGQWPFRRTAYSTPDQLVERLARVQIDHAWVTSLDAVMLKDVTAANEPLAEAVADHTQLTAIGTVNPKWPAWGSDVEACAEQFGMPGVRVNPNYQSWTLEEPVFADLLAAARDLGLFVEIAVRMTDERHHHPLVMVPPVALSGLLANALEYSDVPIVVANAKNAEAGSVARDSGGDLPDNLFFELSHFESVGGVQSVAENIGVEHVLFGTHAPYFYPEAATLKVFDECDFSEADLEAITHANAERLLAGD